MLGQLKNRPSLQCTLDEEIGSHYNVAFSADSKLLAVGSADNKLQVYAIANAEAPRLKYILDDAQDFVVSCIFRGLEGSRLRLVGQ